ncbi:hypothetical protein HHI36_018291 [Cryptolaemus montrouzieri]|uniref:Uncharacterized protein n=1 Tax=Cryptolaemus montrouzieri TaxID=559131 RepID=A0ABD2NZW5_9CUCU
MVLTSQQQSDVKDKITDCLQDANFLATLAKYVADLVADKLANKFQELSDKTEMQSQRMDALEKENNSLTLRLSNMEQRSRSNRLRFFGVRDIENDELTAGIAQISTTKMKMRPADIRIDYFYRIAGASCQIEYCTLFIDG